MIFVGPWMRRPGFVCGVCLEKEKKKKNCDLIVEFLTVFDFVVVLFVSW
jgi:hypothetical protein